MPAALREKESSTLMSCTGTLWAQRAGAEPTDFIALVLRANTVKHTANLWSVGKAASRLMQLRENGGCGDLPKGCVELLLWCNTKAETLMVTHLERLERSHGLLSHLPPSA